jgi:peptidoglycan/xylan/chitin deacetylase (PgdA/CDA1 family)
MMRYLSSHVGPRVLGAATWAYRNFRSSGSPRDGLRVLMYHSIGTPIEGDSRGLYNMAADQFEAHARYLAAHHRQQLVQLRPDAPRKPALQIALTFDDGYRDNLTVAAPVLTELGIPFTVFVHTNAVAQREKGFLVAGEVRELAGLPGVQIGSHSVTHARLTECDDARLREELSGSKSYLEDLLGQKVDALSYPHGAVDQRVRDFAAEAGYLMGGTSRFDINPPGRDPLLLCRTDIWAKDGVPVFEQKLRGDWDWNRWRKADPASAP